MKTRMPRLLTSDAAESVRLNASGLSLQLALLSPSTATMTLPPDEPLLQPLQLVELFKPDGSIGLFRITSVDVTPGHGQSVDMEHTLAFLRDDLTHKKSTISGTMQKIITDILSLQSVKRWQLGDVEITGTHELRADGITLLDALFDAVRLVDDYGIFTEQQGSAWKIHIRKLPTAPTFECRPSRNAKEMQIIMDTDDLCTRVIADALPGGKMEMNVDKWGIVAKELVIPAGATAEQANRYAKQYLKKYSRPALSIKIPAIELSRITGEALDKFELGGMGRAVMAERGIVYEQRLVLMEYLDALNAPDAVHLSMSQPDRRIEDIIVSTRRSAGGAAKKANEAQTWAILADENIFEILNQLGDVYIRLDNAEKTITLKADKIDLQGYVTAEKLAAWGGSISATELYGDIVRAASFWLNGTHVVTRNVQGTDGNTYRALVLSTAG